MTQSATAIQAALRAVMVDPKSCGYCHGTGWVFNDKNYDGYPYGRGPYVEPDDLNGGYHPCPDCNDDREIKFGSGETVKPSRRWDDDEIAEIVTALDARTEIEDVAHSPIPQVRED